LQISRAVATSASPTICAAIVRMRTDPSSTLTPVQIFDPYDIPDLERQDILWLQMLSCPGLLATPSTDVLIPERDSIASNHSVGVSRTLDRNTNNLFLWIVGNGVVNDEFVCSGIIRSLMKFG